jgi:hypothetical protein
MFQLPFIFNYDLDNGTTVIKSLWIEGPDQLLIDRNDNSTPFGKAFFELIDRLETDYGIHDVGFCPDDEFFGYNSYEIDEPKIEEHWEKIVAFFRSESTIKLIKEISAIQDEEWEITKTEETIFTYGDIMNKSLETINEQLTEAGYSHAVAIATEAEITAGAACGQLSLVVSEQN